MTQSFSSHELSGALKGHDQQRHIDQIYLKQQKKCEFCNTHIDLHQQGQHLLQCKEYEYHRLNYGGDNQNKGLGDLSPIPASRKADCLIGMLASKDGKQVFENARPSLIQEDCSTELGYRSNNHFNNQNATNNNNVQRTSFLSSVDYNSFMDRQVGFSPELQDRSQLPNSSIVNNTLAKRLRQEKEVMTERLRALETQKVDVHQKLSVALEQIQAKEIEQDKLIGELKNSKIHIALLEEQTAEREFKLKKEIERLIKINKE